MFVLALFASVVTTTTSLTITATATDDTVRVLLGEEIHLSCHITFETSTDQLSEVRWYRGPNMATPYGSIDVTICGYVSLPCPEVNTTDNRGVVRYEIGTSNEATLTLVIDNSRLEDNTSFSCGAVKDSGNQPQPAGIYVTVIDLPNVVTLTPDYQTTYDTVSMDPVDPKTSYRPTTTPNHLITTVVSSTSSTSIADTTDSTIKTTVIAAIASAGVVIIIILLVIIACLISSRKRRRDKKESRGINFRLSVEINSETNEYNRQQIASPATQTNNQGTDEYNSRWYHGGNASPIYQHTLNYGDQKGGRSTSSPPPPVYAAPTKTRPPHLRSADDCSCATVEKPGRRAQYGVSAFNEEIEMGYQGLELRSNAPPVYALLEPDNEPAYHTIDGSSYATVDKPGKRAQTETSEFDDEFDMETQVEDIPHQVPPVYAVLEADNESSVEINDSGCQDTVDVDYDGNTNTDLQGNHILKQALSIPFVIITHFQTNVHEDYFFRLI